MPVYPRKKQKNTARFKCRLCLFKFELDFNKLATQLGSLSIVLFYDIIIIAQCQIKERTFDNISTLNLVYTK